MVGFQYYQPVVFTNAATWTTMANTITINGQLVGNNAQWQQWVLNQGTATNAWTTWTANTTTYDPWEHWATADPQQRQQLVEAERARQRQYEVEWRQVETQAAEKQRAATARAYELLDSMLNDAQRRTLKKEGWFDVRSQFGNLYRIHRGSHGNIERLDPATMERVETWCVQPTGVPAGDAMLIQKLMLETHEEELFRTANVTPIWRHDGLGRGLLAGRENRSEGLLTGDRLVQLVTQREARA